LSARLTVVRRLGGHELIGPSGVCDQSMERINCPILPPTNQSPGSGGWACNNVSESVITLVSTPEFRRRYYSSHLIRHATYFASYSGVQ
jgi:hypothetical protein